MRKLGTEYNAMKTEAQKKAENKYKKEKVMRTQLDFYSTDQDIIEHLKTVGNRQGYIKDLIRADMNKEKDTH